jgi:hypothetical protein
VAEAALDTAFAAVAGLAVAMPSARRGANLSVMYAQDAFEGASETLTHLTSARRTIVATHKALADAQHQMGLGRVAFGPIEDKPEPQPQPKGVHLRPVEAA